MQGSGNGLREIYATHVVVPIIPVTPLVDSVSFLDTEILACEMGVHHMCQFSLSEERRTADGGRRRWNFGVHRKFVSRNPMIVAGDVQ